MLYVNLFRDGTSLLERQPQGDAVIPVAVGPDQGAELEALLVSAEASAALAGLFLAGVTVGERSRTTPATRPADVHVTLPVSGMLQSQP